MSRKTRTPEEQARGRRFEHCCRKVRCLDFFLLASFNDDVFKHALILRWRKPAECHIVVRFKEGVGREHFPSFFEI